MHPQISSYISSVTDATWKRREKSQRTKQLNFASNTRSISSLKLQQKLDNRLKKYFPWQLKSSMSHKKNLLMKIRPLERK